MDPNQVRKTYQRACLVVHPDKMTGGEHEPLAREIFIQISQAYERFTETGRAL
jgi:curved DNA-binding protein CbpA